jgi:hypothetical protein
MTQYTLLTKRGIIMLFYIKELALLYQCLRGGVLLTESESLVPQLIEELK